MCVVGVESLALLVCMISNKVYELGSFFGYLYKRKKLNELFLSRSLANALQ